jgi:tRNA G37 N-methylase Trm5
VPYNVPPTFVRRRRKNHGSRNPSKATVLQNHHRRNCLEAEQERQDRSCETRSSVRNLPIERNGGDRRKKGYDHYSPRTWLSVLCRSRQSLFSPRFSFEHYRVASLVRTGETVLDMFAGVGPFAVQIAKRLKNVKVYAVDANPYAVEFLKKDIRLNRVEGKVIPILGNSEEVVDQKLSGMADRVIMNLPKQAAKFICAACRAMKPSGGIIHFYGFLKAQTLWRRYKQASFRLLGNANEK